MAKQKTSNKKEEKVEEKIIPVEDKETKKKRKITKKELRNNAHNIEVEIMNISNGAIFYICKKTGEVIELNESGNSTIVTLEVLMNMKNQSKVMLNGLLLSIIDVYEDDISID
ncbi:hypothetical protein, partial [Metaclostridioides mangenotii]